MTVRTPLPGASAARLFAGPGDGALRVPGMPRIALEAPDFASLLSRFETHTGEVKNLLTDAGTKLGSIEAKAREADGRLSEIEQRITRPGAMGMGRGTATKSLGHALIESEEFKALTGSASQRGKARVQIETKAILSASATWGTGVSPSNSLVQADRQPMVELPRRPLVIRDLLGSGQTTSNAIEYPQQTGFTNNAAVVAENTTKPYSNITTDLKSAPVRTIAHLFKASRQILDDAPALMAMIDTQGRYGLQIAEEAEILVGDGTGQHILGLIPQATAYSAPFALTGETSVDRLALAAAQAEVALVPASGAVIHPLDWWKIRLLKDGMGRYLIGDPQNAAARFLWELPVAASMAMTQGTFLVGAFKGAATLFDRMAIEVLVSTENEDDFTKNMVSIRIEERIALAVFRPQGFITGTLP